MITLGLDISTTVTGIAVLESDPQAEHPKILLLDHIEFKGCETLWEKVDVVDQYLSEVATRVLGPVPRIRKFDRMCIEESLQSFRPGFSSAATIVTLAKFNGLVSYLGRKRLGLEPTYIASGTARKRCGIKVQRTAAAGGKNAKQQCFEWCMAGPLKQHVWPLKKNGDPKDWSHDVTDAYIIARAGLTL